MDKQRLTQELLDELLAAPDPDSYLASHDNTPLNLGYHLSDLLDEKGLRKSDIIRASGINATFAYQIFNGERGCSRNHALQLCFAFPLDLEESNRLLKHAGCNELYCRNRRDAIIIFCITHGYTLAETDDELFSYHEDTITSA